MREIYILNKGDSIDKIKYEFGVEPIYSNSKIFGYKYATLNKGHDDVSIVRNYLPIYEYKIKSNETIIDILSRGFKCDCVDAKPNDLVILSKPKSIRYTVKPLETLSDISVKFGVSVQDIVKTNDLTCEKLFVGQILWI